MRRTVWSWMAVVLALLMLLVSCAVEVRGAASYRAAVVQYSPHAVKPEPYSKEAALELMMRNAEALAAAVGEAKAAGAQIVVLPEDGLTGDDIVHANVAVLAQEVPAVGVAACGFRGAPVLSEIACAARVSAVTVVVDVPSVVNGTFLNTQVALGPGGEVLAVYHKLHLYDEPAFSTPAAAGADLVYFRAPFGVTFGMLVCFDGLFAAPTLPLREMGVTHFTFSSYWYSFPPWVTASAFQRSFSAVHGVTMLAANTGDGALHAGSGIYAEGRVLAVANVTAPRATQVVVADVPYEEETVVRAEHHARVLPTALNVTMDLVAKEVPRGDNVTVAVRNGDVRCEVVVRRAHPRVPSPFPLMAAAIDGLYVGFPSVLGCALVQCGDAACAWETMTMSAGFAVEAEVSAWFGRPVSPFVFGIADGGALLGDLQVAGEGQQQEHTRVSAPLQPLVGLSIVGRSLVAEWKEDQRRGSL